MIIKFIYTLGHSNHPTENLIELLKLHNIQVVADVRRNPFSKFVKQYNRESLKKNLENEEYEYIFLGDIMGGKRSPNDSLNIDKGFKRIYNETEMGKNVALLCAEKDPTRCHRSFLLSPFFVRRGINIYHILASGDLISHQDLEEKMLEEFCPEYKQISLFDNNRSELIQEAFKKRIKTKHKKMF
ncbi:DUF488 domain-containing protein [Natranaerofaba carboxydovora]|uniref:DUF488 domain-containing protein n=1 Tax=Natranaerofaba carboxydovora TaxID=2742683 RepID=UPI0030B84A33